MLTAIIIISLRAIIHFHWNLCSLWPLQICVNKMFLDWDTTWINVKCWTGSKNLSLFHYRVGGKWWRTGIWKEFLVTKVLKMLQDINELIIGALSLRDLGLNPHPLCFLLKLVVYHQNRFFYIQNLCIPDTQPRLCKFFICSYMFEKHDK